MIPCQQCGSTLQEGQRFCPICGTPVAAPSNEQTAAPPTNNAAPPNPAAATPAEAVAAASVPAAAAPVFAAIPTAAMPPQQPSFPAVAPAAFNSEAPQKKKKGKAGKIIAVIFILVIALICLGRCASCGGNEAAAEPWPTGPLAQMIPSMDKQCDTVFENEKNLSIDISKDISKEEYDSYLAQCKELGFTEEAEEAGNSYEAFNAEGYKLSIQNLGSGSEVDMLINLDAPKGTGSLSWPSSGPATLLPTPDSSKGDISNNSSSYFSAYVGEYSLDAYNAYVSACIEAGFDVDYTQYDASYHAQNSDGAKLDLSYEGFKVMHVMISIESKSASPSESSNENAAAAESTSSSDSSAGDVTPEFKESMDSYEAFMNEYIEFIQEYQESGYSASMLSDYTSIMAEYAEFALKLSEVKEDELSEADLQYYLEVTSRVEEKALAASVPL